MLDDDTINYPTFFKNDLHNDICVYKKCCYVKYVPYQTGQFTKRALHQ